MGLFSLVPFVISFGGRSEGERVTVVTSNIITFPDSNIININHRSFLPLMPPGSRARKSAGEHKRKRRDMQELEGEDSEDQVQALDSDNLDDDSADMQKQAETKRKKKKKSPTKPKKRRKRAARSEEEESDLELKEGQVVVGRIVRAPKTGQGEWRQTFQWGVRRSTLSLVPPGQISRNTFDFLSQLQKPECNDREWFVLVLVKPFPSCSSSIFQV